MLNEFPLDILTERCRQLQQPGSRDLRADCERPKRLTVKSSLALTSVLIVCCGFAISGEADAVLRTKIEAIVQPLINAEYLVGAVVGVIDTDGRHVFGLGRLRPGSDKHPDGDTVYEIGSITKVFTATLLAEMALRGLLELDDPVEKLLPDSVRVPRKDDRQITLEDLATHTSGLPRVPADFGLAQTNDPYAAYDDRKLYTFLSGFTLPRAPGKEYEYSNVGAGLLGHALSRRAGKPYEELLVKTLCEPLGLSSTRIKLGNELRRRLASGHNLDCEPVGNWSFDVLAGAGALRSTANDMLRFAAANLGLTSSTLSPAIESTHEVRRESAGMGLGWHWIQEGSTLFHNGGTGGYRSFLALDKRRKLCVVMLTNTAAEILDEAGLAVLDALRGKAVAALALRVPAKVKPSVLDSYAGVYRLAPLVKFTVTSESGKIFVQITGQPRARIYPESDEKFFYRAVDAQITFEKGKDGRVTSLVLHQSGQDQRAQK